jgi:hypothetical protein
LYTESILQTFTEGDICDDNPPSRKEDRKKFKTPITTLNMKNDPISTILNKIDAEISTLSRSQSVSICNTVVSPSYMAPPTMNHPSYHKVKHEGRSYIYYT